MEETTTTSMTDPATADVPTDTETVPDWEATADGEAEVEGPIWSRFGDGPMPTLAKTAAIQRAYKAATEFGLPDEFASALAHGVVDPADLRIALNNPTKINVSGGTIEVIDLDMYTPGLVPLPTNSRTMDMRVYPAGGAAGYLGPLTGPRSDPGLSCGLWIQAESVEHSLDEAKRAYDYVLVKNPLKDSVAARGIVMPVTVVYFEMRHRDGQPTMPLLGTADGSSRITGAHAALGLGNPRTTYYDLPTNRDSYRRFISDIVSTDPASLGVTAARRLRAQRNALITPARVFLRFTPQPGNAYDFGRAVAAYVGMLHVDPPRPWTSTGKLEAMAEAVLEVLRSANVLDERRHEYLAGLLTPQAAEEAGLPTERDEQAANVLATLLNSDFRPLVDQGIMEVTAKRSVTAPRRNDVIAELALRPTRSAAVTLPIGDPARERSAAMRAAYLRATHLSEYASRRWRVTGRTPNELLEGALAELERPEAEQQGNPEAWRNRLELAALAQYHMTGYAALKRDAMGDKDADSRGPQDLLKLMLEDERGLRLLRQAVVDGRAGIGPRLVEGDGTVLRGKFDSEGELRLDPDGPDVALSDQWLRYEGFPAGGPVIRPIKFGPETPQMKASRLQEQVLSTIDQIGKLLDDLERVEGPGDRELMDRRGWPSSDTESAVKLLVDAQSKFGYWGQVAARQAAQADQTGAGEHGEDSDEDEHGEE